MVRKEARDWGEAERRPTRRTVCSRMEEDRRRVLLTQPASRCHLPAVLGSVAVLLVGACGMAALVSLQQPRGYGPWSWRQSSLAMTTSYRK